MNDELLLLARANPAPAGADPADLDTRALDALADIRSGRRPQPHRVSGPWRVASAVAAVATAVVIVTVGVPGLRQGPTPAYAATPPALRFEPAASAAETTQQLVQAARSAPPVHSDPRDTRFRSWSLFTRIDDQQVTSAVLPERTVVDRHDDGTVRVTVTQDEPYFPTPEHEEAWRAASRPGEVPGGTLRDEAYPAGAYALAYPDAPPATAAELRPYLEVGHPIAELGTAELFVAVTDLANEWRLEPAQRVAVIEVLAAAPGVEVLGSTTDRLGRPAVGLGVTSELGGLPERRVLLFSASTGGLLASETTLTSDAGALDVAVPAVIGYTVWED